MTTLAGAAEAPSAPAPSRPTDPRWLGADLLTLAAAGGGLAIALLAPRLLPDTDPIGVDPFGVRLAVVALGLGALALLRREARPALPVLVAVAAVIVPFVLWSATPRVLGDVSVAGARLSGRARILGANVVYLVAAGAICVIAVRRLALRVRLRLSPLAVLATLLTVAAMALVFLAIPATLLGRLAVPVATLRRDLPLLGPAFVLQAVAQELAFRGLLLSALERSAPPWLANLGQSLFFGLAHIAVLYEGPVSTIVPVTVALGLGLGWVTQRTGSIWPAIVAHAVLEVGQAYGVLPGLYGLG